jgi:DNA adenine methylase
MRYPGGKSGSGTYQKLINRIPPHDIYVEGFLGGGAVMWHKRPARMNIGIDLDPSALAMHTALVCPGLQLINADGLQWLADNADGLGPDTFVYLDPPYLMDTRATQRPIYRHEFATEAEHTGLLQLITRLHCMVMISGYWSELYQQHLSGWVAESYQSMTHAGPANEWVWMNYPRPMALHDYRYLGTNFRERERIKRRQQRWQQRLARMDDLERYAMLAAIQDYSARASP